MRKRHKDLIGDYDVTVRKIIYLDENNEFVEMKDNCRRYLYQQFDKNRIKYKKGGRHVK